MKVSMGRLRRLLKEDAYLHGVAEWQLREATSDYVDEVRQLIKKHILLNKSENPNDQREAVAAMNDVCDELEKKAFALLEDTLFAYTRRV